MKTTQQTASASLHPPVIAGVSTGGESRGLFDSMSTPKPPTAGTMDYYRERAKSDPEIQDLVKMIDRLNSEIFKMLAQTQELYRGTSQHRCSAMNERRIIDACANTEIPFGKYKGRSLLEVPISYLDQTLSVMPPTWLTRMAQKLVDVTIDDPMQDERHGRSYREMEELRAQTTR